MLNNVPYVKGFLKKMFLQEKVENNVNKRTSLMIIQLVFEKILLIFLLF